MVDSSEQGVRATPETRQKAVEGVIGILQRRMVNGKPYLWPEHVQAAHEIEEAYRLVTKPLETALSNPDGLGRELHYLHSGGERFSPRQDKIYRAYNNWVDELDRRIMPKIFGVVVDIVVEGMRLGMIERRYRLQPGEAKMALRIGLKVHCKVNGRVM